MLKLLALFTENVFVLFGFAIYGGLVYDMFKKAFRGRADKKTGEKSGSRRDFSRSLPQDGNFSGGGGADG